MWNWIKRRKQDARTTALFRAYLDSHELPNILKALSELGVQQLGKLTENVIANGAVALLDSIHPGRKQGFNIEDYEFCDGAFLIVFSNHFSRISDLDFEKTVLLSFLKYYIDLDDGGIEKFEMAIKQYSAMIASESKPIQAIGNLCARWTVSPIEENRKELTTLYEILVGHIN